jgi:hypothetical protein
MIGFEMRFLEGNSEQDKTDHNWGFVGHSSFSFGPSFSFRVGQEVRTKLTEWQEAFVKSICERFETRSRHVPH